jgi:CRP-like cAMP-binding protein
MAPEVIARLSLLRLELPADHPIEHAGSHNASLIFIEEGVASLNTTFANGSEVGIALAGPESVLGTSSLMG